MKNRIVPLEDLCSIKEQILLLRSDAAFKEQGGKLFYALDFCEIYGYLQIEAGIEETDFLIIYKDLEKANASYRLAMVHLFNRFADKFYLLGPHLGEMWLHFMTLREKLEKASSTLYKKAIGIGQREIEILKPLMDKKSGESLSDDETNQILGLVKDQFENICVEISNFINKNNYVYRLDRLKEFMHKLEHTENILKGLTIKNFGDLNPTISEQQEFYDAFPEESKRSRVNVLNDAFAMGYLYKINKLLESKNAKLLLITRDKLIRAALNILKESNSIFCKCESYLRNTYFVFLDIIMYSFDSIEEKKKWLDESLERIGNIEKSIISISTEGQFSLKLQTVIESFLREWESQIELRLSMAVNKLGLIPLTVAGEERDDLLEKIKDEDSKQKYKLLKDFFQFLSLKSYQESVKKECKNIESKMTMDELLFSFSASINIHLSGEEQALRNVEQLQLCILQFDSDELQKSFDKINWESDSKKKLGIIQYLSNRIISSLLSQEPEYWLFMAYILGIVNDWSNALTLAQKGLELATGKEAFIKSSYEIHYFMSIARRMIAMSEKDKVEKPKGLLEAYKLVNTCFIKNPNDPRFICELITLAYKYNEAKNILLIKNFLGDEDVISEDEMCKLLKRAKENIHRVEVDMGRRWLKAEINCNLALICAKKQLWEEARTYLSEVEREFPEALKIPYLYNTIQLIKRK